MTGLQCSIYLHSWLSKITFNDKEGEVIVKGSDVLLKISPLPEALYAFIIAKQFMDSFGLLAQRSPQSELMK